MLLGPQGSSKVYKREATFTEASDLCNELGARLCTVDEIRHNEANPSTCAYDSIFAWTWVDSDHTGACLNQKQSIGVAGAPGAWFSFSAVSWGVYHEIQLRTEGPSSFSMSNNILDKHTEIVQCRIWYIL